MTHPGGRPTKYKEEYCQQLIAYYNKPSTVEKIRTIRLKNGSEIEEPFDAPTKPSHVVDFCDEIGISVATFYTWLDTHKQFSEAYTHAKAYLERNIVDNGLLSNYNPGFAGLVSKNWLGWKDKSEVDQKVSGELKTGEANPALAKEFAEYLKGKTK